MHGNEADADGIRTKNNISSWGGGGGGGLLGRGLYSAPY